MVRVFGNGPEDQDSISGQVITKTLKVVLDSSLLISYKSGISGAVEYALTASLQRGKNPAQQVSWI